jgi:hypothetical protein
MLVVSYELTECFGIEIIPVTGITANFFDNQYTRGSPYDTKNLKTYR